MTSGFINYNFILQNDTARTLYHDYAEKLPIIDFHNHLNPQEIYEDKTYHNLTEVWLGGDHYKWRAMRANGISEKLITGPGSEAYDKYLAYADTIEAAFGNPLYHWTHLELKRYFDIDETLGADTAEKIWNEAKKKLMTREYSVQNLLRKQNVEVLCTTDDPADDLVWHKKIRESVDDIKVIPSFRPGNALDIEKYNFLPYMKRLSAAAGMEINSFDELVAALKNRLEFFIENGCRVTDHSLECDFYRDVDKAEIERIFKKRLGGEEVTEDEAAAFRGRLMKELGVIYADKGLAMQLHIGALRNVSERMFDRIGADTGYDCLNDFNYAAQLAELLNSMDKEDRLPRTILYALNPKDMPMLAAMAGNFQGNEEGIKSKIQLGSAWWFQDHMNGMRNQLEALSDVGLLSGFIGMLTDSRSFLSFPRHEYFRRILCNMIGEKVEAGFYPKDIARLGKMVEDICYYNAKRYFRL
ncbi:MAG: glucuronate isomerase [Eubacterium sp.]|nr:glucuronate isomerase [Eubacterium sp.]